MLDVGGRTKEKKCSIKKRKETKWVPRGTKESATLVGEKQAKRKIERTNDTFTSVQRV
jgi:hypothetical protein